MRFYVYLHKKADTGEVFYVGKGSRPDRIVDRAGRSTWWHATVAKHGLVTEMIQHYATDSQSKAFERSLIAFYGRQNTKTGCLINLTDGGDGSAGIIASAATRAKRSEHARRPRSVEWIQAVRVARKNGGNGGVVKKGDVLPDSWRRAISRGQRGPNNFMRGRTGVLAPNRRDVVDTQTGVKYPTVLLAAESCNLKMKTLYNMLSGHRPNMTALRFS